jgi:hypothetical protein
VVRQREQVGAQVRAARDQAGLCPRAEIAGEQDADAGDLDAHDQRRVVVRHGAGEAGGRPERRDEQVPELRRRRSRAAFAHPHAPRARRRAQRREVRIAERAERQPHLADLDGAEHRRRAPAMVDIRVRHHQQVEAPDAERAERRRHRVSAAVQLRERSTRIHQQRAARRLHQRRVALTDVEKHRARRRRRHRSRRARRERHARAERRDGAQRGAAGDEPERGQRQRREQRRRPGRAAGRRRWQPAVDEPYARERGRGGTLAQAGEPPHPLRIRRDRQGQRREERRRQEHDTRPRHGEQVGGQTGWRRHAELPGRERRCDQPRGGARPHGGLPRPGRRGRRRAPGGQHQAGGRREGELRPRLEQGLGLEGEHRQRGRDQGVHASGRPRAYGGQREREQHHEGPAHGHLPAARQRVRRRQRHRSGQRGPAHVAPRSPAAGPREQATRPGVGERGGEREVQARHRQQMGQSEPREGLAVRRRKGRAVPERERAQQPAAGAGGREPLAERAAPALQPRAQRTARRRSLDPGGVHGARDGAEARARPRALGRRPAGIADPARRAHAGAQPQPVARHDLGQRPLAQVRRQPQQQPRRHGRLAGRQVDRADERDLPAGQAACHRGHAPREARLERRVRPCAGGLLELRRDRERARGGRGREGEGQPALAARAERAAAERAGAGDQRRVRADRAGHRGDDARALGCEKQGKERTHRAPGTGSAVSVANA